MSKFPVLIQTIYGYYSVHINWLLSTKKQRLIKHWQVKHKLVRFSAKINNFGTLHIRHSLYSYAGNKTVFVNTMSTKDCDSQTERTVCVSTFQVKAGPHLKTPEGLKAEFIDIPLVYESLFA